MADARVEIRVIPIGSEHEHHIDGAVYVDDCPSCLRDERDELRVLVEQVRTIVDALGETDTDEVDALDLYERLERALELPEPGGSR